MCKKIPHLLILMPSQKAIEGKWFQMKNWQKIENNGGYNCVGLDEIMSIPYPGIQPNHSSRVMIFISVKNVKIIFPKCFGIMFPKREHPREVAITTNAPVKCIIGPSDWIDFRRVTVYLWSLSMNFSVRRTLKSALIRGMKLKWVRLPDGHSLYTAPSEIRIKWPLERRTPLY